MATEHQVKRARQTAQFQACVKALSNFEGFRGDGSHKNVSEFILAVYFEDDNNLPPEVLRAIPSSIQLTGKRPINVPVGIYNVGVLEL